MNHGVTIELFESSGLPAEVSHPSRLRAFQNSIRVSDFREQVVVLNSRTRTPLASDVIRLSALLKETVA